MSDFHRIKRLPPYVFEQVNRIKAAARANGADIIDLGMGNPDLPASQHVIDKLVETAGKPRTDRYSASKGIAGLRRPSRLLRAPVRREAQPRHSGRGDARLREGFANMAQAITAPGDVVLVPNPSYPIHAFGSSWPEASSGRSRPNRRPISSRRPSARWRILIPKPIALVVCYPSNPTANVASLDFYRDLAAFKSTTSSCSRTSPMRRSISITIRRPPCCRCRARWTRRSNTSMSKTFSMAGWRIVAVGNERLLAALARVKSYLDYGAFAAGAGRGDRGAQRSRRLHQADEGDLQAPPRRADRFLRQGRVDHPPADGLDVCLGADP